MRDRKAYQLKRYYERRQESLSILGGTCVVCGSQDQLEIDHIDPKQKSFSLASGWAKPKDVYFAELSKCQLLCKTHHIEKTRSESTITIHGTKAFYDRGCKCSECRKANAQAQKQWDAKRVWCKSCKKTYYRTCKIHLFTNAE